MAEIELEGRQIAAFRSGFLILLTMADSPQLKAKQPVQLAQGKQLNRKAEINTAQQKLTHELRGLTT